MIRLHDVFDLPELGLTPVHTPGGASPEIRWAHVTELVDPSPWLLGKELLLTTGVALVDEPEDWDRYCMRIKDAGVSVLGMSTGPTLPFPAVPSGLIDAAQRYDLALLHVPHDTLMQTVVQRVSDALHEAANQDLVRSFSVQRQLSEAAANSDGMRRIIEVLQRLLGFQVVVLDDRLRTLLHSGEQAEARIEPVRAELKNRLREGLRWSISEEGRGDSLVVLPLGTEGQLSGILTVTKPAPLTVHDRAALGLTASLLGILLERRQASQKHRRIVEAQLLDGLIADGSTLAEVQQYLGHKGIQVSHVEALCTAVPADGTTLDQFITHVLEACDELLMTKSGDHCVFAIVNAREPLAPMLRAVISELGLGAAGLGERRSLAGFAESLAQARFARSVAISRDTVLLERSETGGYRALMMMGEATDRRRFADAVLAPLDDADRCGRSDLVKTVRAYVASLGNHETTATTLGVHRHTVRSRLARITELTGYDLANHEDFLELWMAVEFRIADSEQQEGGSRAAP